MFAPARRGILTRAQRLIARFLRRDALDVRRHRVIVAVTADAFEQRAASKKTARDREHGARGGGERNPAA